MQHEKDPVDKMKVTKKLLPYDNKIIECRYVVCFKLFYLFQKISFQTINILLLI